MNKDPAGIVHCWEGTELLRAWEGPVQAEACGMDKKILFPKWSGEHPPTDLEEDLEAGFMGLPFIEPARGARVGRPHQLGRAQLTRCIVQE